MPAEPLPVSKVSRALKGLVLGVGEEVIWVSLRDDLSLVICQLSFVISILETFVEVVRVDDFAARAGSPSHLAYMFGA